MELLRFMQIAFINHPGQRRLALLHCFFLPLVHDECWSSKSILHYAGRLCVWEVGWPLKRSSESFWRLSANSNDVCVLLVSFVCVFASLESLFGRLIFVFTAERPVLAEFALVECRGDVEEIVYASMSFLGFFFSSNTFLLSKRSRVLGNVRIDFMVRWLIFVFFEPRLYYIMYIRF